jgi:hypothetical protein
MHTRTGLRKPKNFLKTWADKDATRRLTPRLRVGVVDEDLPFGKEGGRKSWYLSVTQDPDLVETLGPVHGLPKRGKTLLLFEDDVVALVRHVIDNDLVAVDYDHQVSNLPALIWDHAEKRRRAMARKKARKNTR